MPYGRCEKNKKPYCIIPGIVVNYSIRNSKKGRWMALQERRMAAKGD